MSKIDIKIKNHKGSWEFVGENEVHYVCPELAWKINKLFKQSRKTVPEKWLYSKLGGFQKYNGKSWSRCDPNEVIETLNKYRMDIEEGKRIIKELKELPRISHSKLQSILTSIERVVKWNDIERLNIFAYRYLLLCRGWSSHSDLYSFRSVYENVNDLVKDLIDKQHLNQYENFNEGDMDYDYYKQRAEIYNAIIEMVKEYDL